jgi:hypothetical protein
MTKIEAALFKFLKELLKKARNGSQSVLEPLLTLRA